MEVKRGNSIVLTLALYDVNRKPIGDLMEAQGLSFMIKNRPEDEDSAALVTRSKGFGVAYNVPKQGHVQITVDATETASLIGRKYMAFQIEHSDSDKQEVYIEEDGEIINTITFIQDVIR